MKYLFSLVLLLLFSACSFAPLTIAVPDFAIPSGSSASFICYSKITESISVQFASVVYEADALYKPSQGLGNNSTILLDMYGRDTDPDPSKSGDVKCINTTTAADIKLSSQAISLTANESKRISVGGSSLASLVTKSEYWLGGSFDDGTLISLPGSIDFTKGVVKANF